VAIDAEASSTIGEDSSFEGRFSVRGSLRIDGRFEGDALVVEQLSVGPRGRAKTNVVATSVVVEGILIGNITATRRVLLLPTARVLGDVKTPELIIQDGVILEGRCTISHVHFENIPDYLRRLYDRK
jgi:cytoskeletal protein CcmA (bactofilin family)